MRLPDGLAIPFLLAWGIGKFLTDPARTADFAAGKSFHDRDIPASWHRDQAEAERIARLWAARRAEAER